MEELRFRVHQMLQGGLRIFETFIHLPSVPNGRDNIETDLKQTLNDFFEFILRFHAVIIFTYSDILALTPMWHKNITQTNWVCMICAQITMMFFMYTMYMMLQYGQRPGYGIHIPNIFVMACLNLAYLYDGICYFWYPPHSTHLKHHVSRFCTNTLLLFSLISMSVMNAFNYRALKRHQKMLDTIEQLPEKPKGE